MGRKTVRVALPSNLPKRDTIERRLLWEQSQACQEASRNPRPALWEAGTVERAIAGPHSQTPHRDNRPLMEHANARQPCGEEEGVGCKK